MEHNTGLYTERAWTKGVGVRGRMGMVWGMNNPHARSPTRPCGHYRGIRVGVVAILLTTWWHCYGEESVV